MRDNEEELIKEPRCLLAFSIEDSLPYILILNFHITLVWQWLSLGPVLLLSAPAASVTVAENFHLAGSRKMTTGKPMSIDAHCSCCSC